jgi:hypothetical protein
MRAGGLAAIADTTATGTWYPRAASVLHRGSKDSKCNQGSAKGCGKANGNINSSKGKNGQGKNGFPKGPIGAWGNRPLLGGFQDTPRGDPPDSQPRGYYDEEGRWRWPADWWCAVCNERSFTKKGPYGDKILLDSGCWATIVRGRQGMQKIRTRRWGAARRMKMGLPGPCKGVAKSKVREGRGRSKRVQPPSVRALPKRKKSSRNGLSECNKDNKGDRRRPSIGAPARVEAGTIVELGGATTPMAGQAAAPQESG